MACHSRHFRRLPSLATLEKLREGQVPDYEGKSQISWTTAAMSRTHREIPSQLESLAGGGPPNRHRIGDGNEPVVVRILPDGVFPSVLRACRALMEKESGKLRFGGGISHRIRVLTAGTFAHASRFCDNRAGNPAQRRVPLRPRTDDFSYSLSFRSPV